MPIPTFTVIPDERLSPDKPVRSVDALALRDNLYAAFQADEAADPPQVQTAAIADEAITHDKLAPEIREPLFRWSSHGVIYQENSVYDGVVDVTWYEPSDTTQPICRRAPMSAGGTGTLTMMENMWIDIDPDMVTCKFKCIVSLDDVTGDPDNSYLTITIDGIAAVNSAVIPNPTVFARYEIDVPLTATGVRNFKIEVTNPNAANRAVCTLHAVWVYGYYAT